MNTTKPTQTPYALARAEVTRLAEVASVYRLVLCAIADEKKPAAIEYFRIDDGLYTFRLWRALDTHGGLVTLTYRRKGQRPMVEAGYLEEYITLYADAQTPLSLPYKIALERITIIRNRLNRPTPNPSTDA